MTGRPRVSDRQVVNGMVYKIRTGISRRDLPERYGPWQTVDTRFRRYALDGLFTRALHTSKLVRTRPATSTGPSRSTPPSSAPTSTPPPPTEKGAPSAGRTRRSRPRPIPRRTDHQNPSRLRRQGPPARSPGADCWTWRAPRSTAHTFGP
ncbi:transposase [Streptomyces chartreusis]|uniref:transposase n=1 Tax=Streptomyces chartreusis TaxID=1969 RepID=UPI0033EFAD48